MTFARDRVLRGNETTEPQSENPRVAPGAPGIAPTWTSSAKDMVGCALGAVAAVVHDRASASSTRSITRASTSRRSATSASSSPAPTASGPRSSATQNYTLQPVGAGGAGGRDRARAPALRAAPARHPRSAPRRAVDRVRLDGDADAAASTCCSRRISAPPATATPPRSRATAAGACCGPSRGRSAWRSPRPTRHQRDAFGRASAGYVGTSDGWQDFAPQRRDDLAIRSGRAGQCRADRRTAAPRGAGARLRQQRRGRRDAGDFEPDAAVRQRACSSRSPTGRLAGALQRSSAAHCTARRIDRRRSATQFAISAIVLRAHLDKTYPGAMVASLSVPWGDTGDERGGYHLVWPRDLVECAGALLALGAENEARDTLRYLIATQNAGRPLAPEPVARRHAVLAGRPARRDRVSGAARRRARRARRAAPGSRSRTWCAARSAIIARTGPSTAQDRWEENEGINAFTLARLHRGAGRRRRAAAAAGTRLGAGARRFLERPDRGLDHRRRHATGAAVRRAAAITCGSRRREVLDRPAARCMRSCRSATAADDGGLRGRRADRHRIPAACPLRLAPRRRSADPSARCGSPMRCSRPTRRTARSGIAIAATAMASTTTAGL